MAEEEQIQASSEEILFEKLHKNVEIACNGKLDERLSAVDFLINELRQLAHAPVEERPALMEKFRDGYEARRKAHANERKKSRDSLDIKQLTIDATASPTPTTGA